MKVLLLGNYRDDRQFSMLGFEAALTKWMPENGLTPDLAYPQARAGALSPLKKFKKIKGYVDKLILFPAEIRRISREYDLVHITDQGNANWVKSSRSPITIVTCHDVFAIRTSLGETNEVRVSKTGRRLQSLNLQGLRDAHHIACVSGSTLKDVQQLVGHENCSLVENGLYRDMHRMSEANARKELSGILADSTSPFILHVGSNSMYKNRPGLVKIYLELVKLMPDCPRLIMAGDVIPDDLRTLIGENFGSGRIVEVKSPSSLQVDALFSLAEALIFPSLVEGFGVPILEAQATGCPIFSSNRPPLPEVARGAAIHFDPDNISGAAQLIHNNWNLRANLIEQGYRAVEGRTPSDMAARYISLYNRLGSPKR